MLQDADALPQLIGDWKTVDQWQTHINQLFYRFRGNEIRKYYQTFASADYRLAHALAADYVEQVSRRDKTSKDQRAAADTRPLTRMGNRWRASGIPGIVPASTMTEGWRSSASRVARSHSTARRRELDPSRS